MKKFPASIAAVTALAGGAAAQQPPQSELIVSPSAYRVAVPALVSWNIFGTPSAPFALFADPQPGPHGSFAELNLALSPELISVQFGVLDPFGAGGGSVQFTPPTSMAGLPLYLQHVELPPVAAGRPHFGTPDGIAFHGGGFAIVDNFRTRGHQWRGNFDRNVPYRLQGAPVRHRTHRTVDPQGFPFAPGVRNPLNPYGARTQMVFRATDVGATGDAEQLVAVRWRPAAAPIAEAFASLDLIASHSRVVPDYTIDPWTALPAAPQSGLDPAFDTNRVGQLVVMHSGSYAVRPMDLTPSGYMPYPMRAEFTYDGSSSLLLELLVQREVPARPPVNAQAGRLMATSSPDPAARVVAEGTASTPIGSAPVGRGDNLLYDYELEFVRETSTAVSPWFAGGAAPDYMAPVIAHQVPRGTSYTVEFRGALNAQGAGATAWSRSQDVADGLAFIQVRVQFVGNRTTGAVPYIDTFVLPLR